MLTSTGLTLTQVVLAVFLADFCSGVVHWIQDRYELSKRSLLNRIVILYAKQHHETPHAFTRLSWWERNSVPTVIVGSMFAVMWLTNSFHWQIGVFLVLFMFSGEFHLWSHRTPDQNGWVITFLHQLRFIQRPNHHRRHHNGYEGYYCVITDFLNPVLNRFRVFPMLETAVSYCFGLTAHDDNHVEAVDAAYLA